MAEVSPRDMRREGDGPEASAGEPAAQSPERPKRRAQPATSRVDAFVRAEGEDDDGYDPYSDRPYREPLWERDPWS